LPPSVRLNYLAATTTHTGEITAFEQARLSRLSFLAVTA
jgi:hypothetical protein